MSVLSRHSFGLVALESLACGTPVVTTRVGGAENIIRHGETGYLVADNDPRSLADNITLALSRSDNNEHLESVTRTSLEPFGWSHIAEAIARECRAILASGTEGTG